MCWKGVSLASERRSGVLQPTWTVFTDKDVLELVQKVVGPFLMLFGGARGMGFGCCRSGFPLACSKMPVCKR